MDRKYEKYKYKIGFIWVLSLMRRMETTQRETIIDNLRTRKAMLTSSEVTDLLRITRATLCGWCRNGKVPTCECRTTVTCSIH